MDPFEEAVVAMRQAQREYFASGSKAVLIRAKDCERKVDQILDRRRREREQPSLIKDEQP